MNFKYLILSVFIISCVIANAQDLRTGNIHHFTFSIGNDFNLLKTTQEIPPQVLHRKHNFSVSFKYSVFPFHKWGMYIETEVISPLSASRDFSDLNSKYQEQYYIDNIDYDKIESSFHWNFGVMYRMENRHFSFLPYIGIGFNEAMIGNYSYRLKEKGSNSLYEIKYSTEKEYRRPTVSHIIPGVALNYKITKQLHLSLDVNYRQAIDKTKIKYQKVDLYNDEVIEEKKWKKSTEQHLNVKLGLSVAFGFRRNR